MGQLNIDGAVLTPLKKILSPQGNIYHGMKKSEDTFVGFGEAYFSTVKNNEIKAWKRHQRMTLNLMVPVGKIKFVLFDDRKNSATEGNFFEVELSLKNYQRLTVPPKIWCGFQGKSQELNILLNIANLEHDQKEVDKLDIHVSNYQ